MQALKTLLMCLLLGAASAYRIGVGIHDITGPCVQVNFMGYAALKQIGRGIHMRLHSRAFVIADDDSTVAYVSLDGGMGSDLLNIRVLQRLDELMPDHPFTMDNLAIAGTHSHSGPAGFLQYVLYQFTSLGYSEETTDAFVEGISQSIFKAHSNLQEGTIQVNTGGDLLMESNINRSPSSYLLNPQEERDLYTDIGDTDKNMFLLKFTSSSTKAPIGMLNWFAVHGTSMNNTNVLISGDNKGYAEYMFEKKMNGNDALPGKGDFVAAFASTNLGDVSPNTAGPKCLDTGLPCDTEHSTCNGKNEMCVAFGPGKDMVESTKIIGNKQFEHAVGLFEDASTELSGPIAYRHSFLDMRYRPVTLPSGETVKTCPAALGYAFAAGTTDGPGMFNFVQGTNTSNPFWNIVSGFISKPTDEEKECQHPKPILLNTGDVEKPYDWDPATVPISVFRVGQMIILNAPGELTTMAGRRLRASIKSLAESYGMENPLVTISGLTNTYTHYIATYEEYQAQRYEAASTLYGPHTLDAYIQEFTRITKDLFNGEESESDAAPEDLTDKQFSLIPPVIVDFVGIGQEFGAVSTAPEPSYAPSSVVSATFHAANPRNNQRIEGSYFTIDKKGSDSSWETKFIDSDWCTKFKWEGGVGHEGKSYATVEWDLAEAKEVGGESGTYRICYSGTRKHVTGKMEEFQGCTDEFEVEI